MRTDGIGAGRIMCQGVLLGNEGYEPDEWSG